MKTILFILLLSVVTVSSYANQKNPISPRSFAPARIALIQYDADKNFGSYEINRANLTFYLNQAVANQAKIVVFPEGSLYGYASTDRKHKWCRTEDPVQGCHDVAQVAEKVPGGPSTGYWEAQAREKQIYILFNLPELGDKGRFYNTTVIVGPDGFVGSYRKRRLYSTDQFYASPGSSSFILKTPYGIFGLLICMDATERGLLEKYVDQGITQVILMMDWDEDPFGSGAARTFFQTRSSESGATIFASDMSTWDGAGVYRPGRVRERFGLPPLAIGTDGITIHEVP